MTPNEMNTLSSLFHLPARIAVSLPTKRRVADLPCAGRDVMLLFTVRKFVCGTSTCPQKIFTERLPDLVESYTRMTTSSWRSCKPLDWWQEDNVERAWPSDLE